MVIFSWLLAIFLSLFLWTSLSLFPKFYKNKKTYTSIRLILIVFLLFVQLQRTWYLHLRVNGWGNPADYFLLYFCSLSAWAAIVILIYPNKRTLNCFFPYMIMGPVVTFIFPTEKPVLWDINFFTFYLSHACTLFTAMYIYLYGYTDYKLSKDSIVWSAVTGFIVVFGVEVYNLYFDQNFIIGDVAGAFNITHLKRPLQLLITFVGGVPFVFIGLSFTYFFKPIYIKEGTKVHNTWWENFLIKVKEKRELKLSKK